MNIVYKTPKGTIDYYGESARKLNYMLSAVQAIFKQNGGELLETPVFEKKEIVMGKYGEEAETKLIYEIAENGGEKLVLRYDLTIPFVRFIQENGIKKCKRYSIGKVYRRDNPNVGQGRFREFYQCDFDILGENNSNMMSEAVILNMVNQIMKEFCLPSYKIIINDTENLCKALELVLSTSASTSAPTSAPTSAVVAAATTAATITATTAPTRAPTTAPTSSPTSASVGAGVAVGVAVGVAAEQKVPAKLFKSICSTIDKLDKVSFKDIRGELAAKGLSVLQIDKLEELLRENGIYDENARKRLNTLYDIAEIWGFEIRSNITLV